MITDLDYIGSTWRPAGGMTRDPKKTLELLSNRNELAEQYPNITAEVGLHQQGAKPGRRKLALILKEPGVESRLLEFDKELLTVGRGQDCDVVLSKHTVSGRHCQIRRASGKTWIEDLGSTNGTYVNQERIFNAVPLTQKDRVSIGDYALRLAPPPPPKRKTKKPTVPPAGASVPASVTERIDELSQRLVQQQAIIDALQKQLIVQQQSFEKQVTEQLQRLNGRLDVFEDVLDTKLLKK